MAEALRFHFRLIQGILISLFLLLFGAFITWQKDIRNDGAWYGKYTSQKNFIVATIAEPLQEKEKSFKAIATANTVIVNGKMHITKGRFLIYFSKDTTAQKLKYGDRIIVNKSLSPILNSGNPEAFNYAQYCAFRQLYQ